MSEAASNGFMAPRVERDASSRGAGKGGGFLMIDTDTLENQRTGLDERQRRELESLLARVEERAMDTRLSAETARRYDDEARALRARLRSDSALAASPGQAA